MKKTDLRCVQECFIVDVCSEYAVAGVKLRRRRESVMGLIWQYFECLALTWRWRKQTAELRKTDCRPQACQVRDDSSADQVINVEGR